MRKINSVLSVSIFVSVFLFLFSTSIHAQGAVIYDFLEVVDYANKPVAGATVKVKASCEGGEYPTNEKGQPEKGLPIGIGDCRTYDFTISKPGYYPFQDIGIFRFLYSNDILQSQYNIYSSRQALRKVAGENSSRPTIRIELLPVPRNKTEQKAIGREQLKRELFGAIGEDNAEQVKKLLKSGIDPNITTDDLRGIPGPVGLPAVLFAASFGDIELVRPFLKAGVNLRKKDSPLKDILLYYLSNNQRSYLGAHDWEAVDILIKAGADLNVVDPKGNTNLMAAIRTGNIGIAEILIKKGANVNAGNYDGETPLMRAVRWSLSKNNPAMTNLLLQAGANPNAKPDRYCRTVLMEAFSLVDSDTPEALGLIQTLIDHKADVNFTCGNGDSALLAAVAWANLGGLKKLVDSGADVKGEQGQRALKYAREHLRQDERIKAKLEPIIRLLETSGAKE